MEGTIRAAGKYTFVRRMKESNSLDLNTTLSEMTIEAAMKMSKQRLVTNRVYFFIEYDE